MAHALEPPLSTQTSSHKKHAYHSDPLPLELLKFLEHKSVIVEQLLIAALTDIDLSGNSQEEWLILTPAQLTVITDHKEEGIKHNLEYALSEIKKIRTWSGLGSGIVQVSINDTWIDVIRYSNKYADRFNKLAHKIQQVLDGEKFIIHDDEDLEAYRCPTCQMRLSTRRISCPRCFHKQQIAEKVWELLYPQMWGTIGLCLLTIIGVVAELVPPKLQQYLVDVVLTDQQGVVPQKSFVSMLFIVVMALAASRVVLSLVSVFKGRLAVVIGSSLTYQLRGQMVDRLQKLAIAYYDRHQIGSLISRVAYDSEAIQGLMHQLTGGFLLQIFQLVGIGAMLVWLNPKLALYTLIPVPLVFMGSWYFWNYVYPKYYRLWDSSAKQISSLNGMLQGIRVVKAFGQEQREFNNFQQTSGYLRDSRLWVEHANNTYGAIMGLVFSLGGLIVWYVGGKDVIGNEMTLGELIAFLAYLAMFYAPLSTLSSFTSWLSSFMTGSKRVLEVLDAPLTITEAKDHTSWENVQGEIRFEHVSFGYDRHQPVLHDVSFYVKPGEMVGIVGRSGSGKTTMVNLLGRFYDVQEGAILIDGIDVRSISMTDLRKHLGIVFQESFIFRGNIWDNLVYGQPEVSIEAGLKAAKAAGAHDFICRAPLGYESPLGEHGAGISGGEKQRLSIARTLLYDPKILVLDEATSNIDAEAERSIQQALEILIKGRTTIAIAHRLSTLRNADRILVFERGRLIEEGSHAQLIAQDGTYSRLVKIQTQISKDPNVDKLMTVSPTHNEQHAPAIDESPAQSPATEKPDYEINWLSPENCQFQVNSDQTLEYSVSTSVDEGRSQPCPVFLVNAFPASHPEAYLSVRSWSEHGDEIEVGMLRDLADWSPETQECLRRTLQKRYLLREIDSIHQIKLAHGYLEFDVETDKGPMKFLLRWSQSHAQEFGKQGKILSDTEDNRYLIRNVQQLNAGDRELFLKYIYW